MKFHILILVLSQLIGINILCAQKTINEILSNQSELKEYTEKTGLFSIALPMKFGSSVVNIPYDKENLKNANIREIHVVYTDYPEGTNLNGLNANRIRVLTKLRPSLLTDTTIVWKVIKQTGCSTQQEAENYFHGLMVYFLPDPMQRNQAIKFGNALNEYVPNNLTKEEAIKIVNKMNDTLVYHVLNKADWSDMAVITDFTSSMYPYSAQVMLWFAINTNQTKISNIYFFNDGNMMNDSIKVDGKVGGIYHEKKVNYKDVRKLAFIAMKNGIGGKDLVENDVEAVLFALKKSPNVKGYVLIADNNAPPRDMSLLGQLNKPIHIILCGARVEVFNPETLRFEQKVIDPLDEYVKIAQKTGGSIISMEEDLQNRIIEKNINEIKITKKKVSIQTEAK